MGIIPHKGHSRTCPVCAGDGLVCVEAAGDAFEAAMLFETAIDHVRKKDKADAT